VTFFPGPISLNAKAPSQIRSFARLHMCTYAHVRECAYDNSSCYGAKMVLAPISLGAMYADKTGAYRLGKEISDLSSKFSDALALSGIVLSPLPT